MPGVRLSSALQVRPAKCRAFAPGLAGMALPRALPAPYVFPSSICWLKPGIPVSRHRLTVSLRKRLHVPRISESPAVPAFSSAGSGAFGKAAISPHSPLSPIMARARCATGRHWGNPASPVPASVFVRSRFFPSPVCRDDGSGLAGETGQTVFPVRHVKQPYPYRRGVCPASHEKNPAGDFLRGLSELFPTVFPEAGRSQNKRFANGFRSSSGGFRF